MNNGHHPTEVEVAAHQMKEHSAMFKRGMKDLNTLSRIMVKLVSHDVEQGYPTYPRYITSLMRRVISVADYSIRRGEYLLKLVREWHTDMPHVQNEVYNAEDIKKGITDLGLDYLNMAKPFQVDEEIVPPVSPEEEAEAEAEMVAMYAKIGKKPPERK